MDGSRGEAILPIVAARWRKNHGNDRRLLLYAIIAIVSVIFPSAIMIGRASLKADEVLKGRRVESFQVATLPLVDIDAIPSEMIWTGPQAQKPGDVSLANGRQSTDGLLLGQSSAVVYVFVYAGGQLRFVRLPASNISVVLRQ